MVNKWPTPQKEELLLVPTIPNHSTESKTGSKTREDNNKNSEQYIDPEGRHQSCRSSGRVRRLQCYSGGPPPCGGGGDCGDCADCLTWCAAAGDFRLRHLGPRHSCAATVSICERKQQQLSIGRAGQIDGRIVVAGPNSAVACPAV